MIQIACEICIPHLSLNQLQYNHPIPIIPRSSAIKETSIIEIIYDTDTDTTLNLRNHMCWKQNCMLLLVYLNIRVTSERLNRRVDNSRCTRRQIPKLQSVVCGRGDKVDIVYKLDVAHCLIMSD